MAETTNATNLLLQAYQLFTEIRRDHPGENESNVGMVLSLLRQHRRGEQLEWVTRYQIWYINDGSHRWNINRSQVTRWAGTKGADDQGHVAHSYWTAATLKEAIETAIITETFKPFKAT